MDPETSLANPQENALQHEKTKDGSITFTVVMMILAVICVGITLAITFYDMSQVPSGR
ncbi:MAG: hypothetical protein U0441_26200 [Polyangiaceae bacterium]